MTTMTTEAPGDALITLTPEEQAEWDRAWAVRNAPTPELIADIEAFRAIYGVDPETYKAQLRLAARTAKAQETP